MRTSMWAAILLLSWMAPAQNTFNFKKDYHAIVARTKDQNDKLFYDTQIKRFTANDATLTDFEVLALLIGFSAKPEYNPTKGAFKEFIIYELNSAKDYTKASRLADKELKNNPLGIKNVYGKSYALLKLEQKDSAAYYARQWQKILKAMFLSGRGMSIDDPIFSLGPDDGNEFITMYIGAQVAGKRRAKNSDGLAVEIYEAVLDNKKLTLHFMIDPAIRRMDEESNSK